MAVGAWYCTAARAPGHPTCGCRARRSIRLRAVRNGGAVFPQGAGRGQGCAVFAGPGQFAQAPGADCVASAIAFAVAGFPDLFRRAALVYRLSCYLPARSEEHTSELQSLMRISYAVF